MIVDRYNRSQQTIMSIIKSRIAGLDKCLNEGGVAMLQEMTIKTEDRATLEPLLRSAIDNEKKMISIGLERTRQRLAEFEHKYEMESSDFERRLNSLEIDETVEFSEWRMEIGMLRLLERQYKALQNAELD
jgi:hypothetical protein